SPRIGLLYTLTVAFFPLANISLGLAIVYAALAAAWIALSWRDARAGLLLAVGPLLAPVAALALLPLAAPLARGRMRRALQAGRGDPAARCRFVADGRRTGVRASDINSVVGGTDPTPMSVLRNIESKLESLFEGVFGRAFRTNVQPVELARKLVKEMDDHRNVSVSRVYVPNEYTIYLSPGDREQFESYQQQLQGELADYLAEHARREHVTRR